MVHWYQTEQKITHGNPLEVEHSAHMLDVGALVTCDRAFYSVRWKVREDFQRPFAIPVFVDRQKDNAGEMVRNALLPWL